MKKLLSLALAVAVLLSLALPALAEETGERGGEAAARTEVRLSGDEADVRTGETNLGDLVADAILWHATKDGGLEVERQHVVAVVSGGDLRGSIEAGDITPDGVRAVLPSGSTVAVIYVPGSVLLEALEASTFCAPAALESFPQVAGLEFTVNTTVPYDRGAQYVGTAYYSPASVNRVSIQSAGGWSFDPSAVYAVVTNDLLAAGGGTYCALGAIGTVVDTAAPLDEVVMDYIATQLGGTVTAAAYGETRGRIHILEQTSMWYDAAVREVTEAGIMNGTLSGFAPDAVVDRATVFQTLYNLEGRPAADHTALWADAQGMWYEDAASWARQTGLAQGTGAGFEGGREIVRSEIVVILSRYAAYKGMDLSAYAYVDLQGTYGDAWLLTAWATDAFRWAVGSGVLAGKTDETGVILAPGHTATRAELAQILVNYTHFFL